MKPELIVDLGGITPAALPALNCLSALMENATFHEVQDRRHPLGTYGLSVNRICDKICKCAKHLEHFWGASHNIAGLQHEDHLRSLVTDYLELCLYAAAEHIDDVESIAECFYKTPDEVHRSAKVRSLKRALKPLRDRVCSFTNTVKHAQGRLRLFSLEFNHGGRVTCLHGFFVEGFADGAVGPNKILHGQGETIVSVTSFLWSILIYLKMISAEVEKFLVALQVVDAPSATHVVSSSFRNAVIGVARLPLYSMDDIHPFESIRVIIRVDEQSVGELRSRLYGSLTDRWSKSDQAQFGNTQLWYEGDGASRSFRLVAPKKVQLQHWE